MWVSKTFGLKKVSVSVSDEISDLVTQLSKHQMNYCPSHRGEIIVRGDGSFGFYSQLNLLIMRLSVRIFNLTAQIYKLLIYAGYVSNFHL